MEDENEKSDDILTHAKERFTAMSAAESENRDTALEDIRFAKLGEQWPNDIKSQRKAEGRPIMTINRLQAFGRQVVNDTRQNKPAIKVKAADSDADPQTADVMTGLIRNIEHVSNADTAYDTAVENAVYGGFGYIRVGVDFSYDDVFEKDINIDRVLNPFSVYGDPHATSADGSDWNECIVVERITKDKFKVEYGEEANVDFEGSEWENAGEWLTDEGVLIAEFWQREEVEKTIFKIEVQSDNGVQTVVRSSEQIEDAMRELIDAGAAKVIEKRTSKSHKVTQYILSGAEVLETNEWPGKYIPIIPVYGDEFSIEGKRYFRSLINQAKDAQRNLNVWRSASAELVASAPRVPWLVALGSIVNPAKWGTANTKSHSYLEYDPSAGPPPQRQSLDSGPAAGALQEALSANDDIKSIIGMHDASLGARSNETSGRAIMARQREGDVSTFHFADNLSRSIRHVGRVVIDLIPHVYSGERVIRVLGEDGTEENKTVNKQHPKQQPVMANGVVQKGPDGQPAMETPTDEQGQAIMAMYDLTAGKYDLVVEAGPSFTTRREEAASQMIEMVRANPGAAPIMMDILAKNLDWPEADKIAERFAAMLPPQAQAGPDPHVQQMMEQTKQAMGQLNQKFEAVKQENTSLKLQLQNKQGALAVNQQEADTKQYAAVTDRMEAMQSPIYP